MNTSLQKNGEKAATQQTDPQDPDDRNLPYGSLGQKSFEPLLDCTEAAKLLRMHPKTVRAKARKGEIPGIQIGRAWRFRASALNQWIETIAS
jgi:excisionase family DNA binding protein